jgi:cation diffusion facilitator CzcD-associated flavoprotein CzcO
MAGSSSRVAIIGAGVSGLVALTALRRAGHDAIIFEKTDRVGGQWNSLYDSVHLLSAKSATQFEGFPMPDDLWVPKTYATRRYS